MFPTLYELAAGDQGHSSQGYKPWHPAFINSSVEGRKRICNKKMNLCNYNVLGSSLNH